MIGTNNKGVDTYGKQVYEDKEGSDTPNHLMRPMYCQSGKAAYFQVMQLR